MKHTQLVLIACAMAASASLQAQTPVLKVDGKAENTGVTLQALDLQVEVTGHVATTTFTMTFKNNTGRTLEGELIFPLPDGATVSHYALDINKKMRKAVPVEKAKATRVFEEIERRNVDPGLVERVEGNNFRVRVYPIWGRGYRVVSIGYEQELPIVDGQYRYRLPLDYKEAIDHFTLNASVWQGDEAPRVKEFDGALTFDKQGRDFVASFSREKYRPPHLLDFSLPAPAAGVPRILMQSASGSHYFVTSYAPAPDTREKQWANHIGIIWDASLSSLKRDVPGELDLLDALFQKKKNATVTLYFLDHRLAKGETFRVKKGEWSALRTRLEKVTYDGGTNYEAIALGESPAREFLLFSDGLSTLGEADFPVANNRSVHCITSSPQADYSSLGWIARKTGGKLIRLNALSREEAVQELVNDPLLFLGAETSAGVREVYPSVATPVRGHFSVAGILDASTAHVTLLFGRGNKVEQRARISLNAQNSSQQGNLHRVWAQKKIAELDVRYEQNKEEIVAIGKQFGIVTRETSLLVLESVQDYLTHDVTPPDELRDEFLRLRKIAQKNDRRTHQSLLENAVHAIAELKKWWNTDFKTTTIRYPQPNDTTLLPITDELALQEDSRMETLAVAQDEWAGTDVAELSNHIVVAETGTEERNNSRAATQPSGPLIRLIPPRSDEEYLRSLTGNAERDYSAYLELRPKYINTPAFYFHVADHFYRLGDCERALRVLTSVAEIDLENVSLFRLLGYRLGEYGEHRLALHVTRQVSRWRPDEPQGYRDHALALASAGRQQEALNSLLAVLTREYPLNVHARAVGSIDEVVVTEINRLLAKNVLDATGVDARLVQPLPVDVRVVLNWNMDHTDIDLHVTDPAGETCFYSHRQTASGGRISRDVTTGYGPEQFMIKKALPGKYEVFVNYFGDSQVKIDGPSTLMLEIYARHAGKNEERKVICLQLDKNLTSNRNGLLKVAEFTF